MKGKIIGVGFQKTGTSTLREALKILGFRVKDTSPKALLPILRGNFKRVHRILKHYDAVEDTPWYMIYQELDQMYPESKFILTVRDSESWFESVASHIGDLRAAHHEWIYGRGKGLPKDHKENTIAVYERHNKEVQEYFKDRPNDFILIDFTRGDGWGKLCSFLNLPVPDTDMPHANKSSDVVEVKQSSNYQRMIRRHRWKNNLKIFWIKALGLLPS